MPKKKPTTKAVGYVRRSNHNEDSGSFERQETAIKDFSKRNNYEIVEDGFYYDGSVSGTTSLEEREGLLALINRCREDGIKVAIIQESGRLARRLLCQLVITDKMNSAGIDLLDCSGNLLSADKESSPETRMIAQILGAIKEMERAEITAKMKAGKERKRKLGFRVEGKARFGSESPQEKVVLKRIAQIRRSHGNAKGVPAKWTKVTKRINDENFRNRSGGEFTSAYVRKLAKENCIR